MTDSAPTQSETNAPRIIYLQDGGGDGEPLPSERYDEQVTWCGDSIEDDDTKYIRFDEHERELVTLHAALAEAEKKVAAYERFSHTSAMKATEWCESAPFLLSHLPGERKVGPPTNISSQMQLLRGAVKLARAQVETLQDRAEKAEAALAAMTADLENERQKVAGCSTAAFGYWKEGDALHPDYECAAIHDVARTYAKYVAAEQAASALKQDAERLDWVEARGPDGIHIEVCGKVGPADLTRVVSTVYLGKIEVERLSLRESIDAAIAALAARSAT